MKEKYEQIKKAVEELSWTSGFIRASALLEISIEECKEIYLTFNS